MIAQGSLVLPKYVSPELPGIAAGSSYTPQAPNFGVVLAAGPPVIVLWDNGIKSSIAVATALDDLFVVDTLTQLGLNGQVVRLQSESPEYQYVVVALYRRSSREADELALLLTLDGTVFREVPVSQLTTVVGR